MDADLAAQRGTDNDESTAADNHSDNSGGGGMNNAGSGISHPAEVANTVTTSTTS